MKIKIERNSKQEIKWIKVGNTGKKERKTLMVNLCLEGKIGYNSWKFYRRGGSRRVSDPVWDVPDPVWDVSDPVWDVPDPDTT